MTYRVQFVWDFPEPRFWQPMTLCADCLDEIRNSLADDGLEVAECWPDDGVAYCEECGEDWHE